MRPPANKTNPGDQYMTLEMDKTNPLTNEASAFISRWVGAQRDFIRGYRVDLEELEDGLIRFNIIGPKFEEDDPIEFIELYPELASGDFWTVRDDGAEVNHVDLTPEQYRDVIWSLSNWYRVLITDDRVTVTMPDKNRSFKEKTAEAEALISDEVYQAFKAQHDRIEAAEKYPYNNEFIETIPGLKGEALDTQASAIYIMQGRYRDDKAASAQQDQVRDGYQDVGQLSGTDGPVRVKYDEVILYEHGTKKLTFAEARVIYDENGQAEFILPKGKRTRGKRIYWHSYVGSNAPVRLLARVTEAS
jgi:hypothetical protein